MRQHDALILYQSEVHRCSYLPNRDAVDLFADPQAPMNPELYSMLVQQGFRRSGPFVYRPYCQSCTQCIPIRVRVKDYVPNRSQRRNWQRNQSIEVRQLEPVFGAEHYTLYQRYLKARHPQGGMDNPTPDSYRRFLCGGWSDAIFLEFREASKLLCVAVTDRLTDGLSAVYTFYDPQETQRGLGNFAIQTQLSLARQLRKPLLYLGYWIPSCDKMRYKVRFSGAEIQRGGVWLSITDLL